MLPLSAWLERKHPIPPRFYKDNFVDVPTKNWMVWVALEDVTPLHLVATLEWQSLSSSIKQTKHYLNEASKLIYGLDGGWLDPYESDLILTTLGEPPKPCLPLYIITCVDKENEKIVYIGKTKSSSRFSGGHSAALKLHHPKYKNQEKKVYRCSVMFYFNDEYVALDWIQPEKLALDLFDNIETKLIQSFQPELNIAKKQTNQSKWNFSIHIQNIFDSGFLNDTII